MGDRSGLATWIDKDGYLEPPFPLYQFKGLQGADHMENFIKEAGQLLNQKAARGVDPELIFRKLRFIQAAVYEFVVSGEVASDKDRKELFFIELDRRIGELKFKTKFLDSSDKKKTDDLLSEDFSEYLETIKLFLKPEYIPPSDYFNLRTHLMSLVYAYIAVLKNQVVNFNALQQLDLAAFKILPFTFKMTDSFEEMRVVKKKDGHIIKARKISKSKREKPERHAFNDAILQLVTENELFTELPPRKQLRKIRERMIKNGFSANDLIIMHRDKKSGQSGKWLKKEISHLTTK